MSEWWTYRPTSFLLFSERTYHRLFELSNEALWPAPIVTLLLGIGLLALAARQGRRPAQGACALLAAAWVWVAWGFHLQRYATINWAATAFAAAFAVQGLLLAIAALARAPNVAFTAAGLRRAVGLGIVVVAVAGHPLLAPLAGRPWMQAEVFGLAPDPTALATIGVLLLLGRAPRAGMRRAADRSAPSGAASARDAGTATSRPLRTGLLWPVPLAWCALTGLTLWAMDAPGAALAPSLAGAALLIHALAGTGRAALPGAGPGDDSAV